jgi:uncharacterized protein YbjQ (UPF0145 family)
MVPAGYLDKIIQIFPGGAEELVRAYNRHELKDARIYSCVGASKITAQNVKVLDRIILELGDAYRHMEDARMLPNKVVRRAEALGADAIINYNEAIRYVGFWVWRRPVHIKIICDAVKIE